MITIKQIEAVRDKLLCKDVSCKGSEHDAHNEAVQTFASELIALAQQPPSDGWQPMATCEPFNGLVAYVLFEDGFYSLATYKEFDDEKGHVAFWSLSSFHDDSAIYKYYGNTIEPTHWLTVPKPPFKQPPSEDMVKLVARAMCISSGVNPDNPVCDIYIEGDPDAGYPWASYRRQAKAAIEAIMKGE